MSKLPVVKVGVRKKIACCKCQGLSILPVVKVSVCQQKKPVVKVQVKSGFVKIACCKSQGLSKLAVVSPFKSRFIKIACCKSQGLSKLPVCRV